MQLCLFNLDKKHLWPPLHVFVLYKKYKTAFESRHYVSSRRSPLRTTPDSGLIIENPTFLQSANTTPPLWRMCNTVCD